jgi:hypothetical protein
MSPGRPAALDSPSMREDPRRGYSPTGVFAELAATGVGMALLWYHPGSRAVVILNWPRLLLLALPVLAGLLALERHLSRTIRREDPSAYPSIVPVLLVLLGLSVTAVGMVNGLGPSAVRVVHPGVRQLVELQHPLPRLPPAPHHAARADGLAVVDSWREEDAQLQIPIASEDMERAQVELDPALEVREADGFLGVAYVRSVRFVSP